MLYMHVRIGFSAGVRWIRDKSEEYRYYPIGKDRFQKCLLSYCAALYLNVFKALAPVKALALF